MKKHRKQHVISKTYLKHFSINSDGKDLFIIDHENQSRRGIQRIQKRNSGDREFWEENYSDTSLFKDKKIIEKIFGTAIEPLYNKIIETLKKENPCVSFKIKEDLMNWIFYTKMRSPIWETTSTKNNTTSQNRYSQQLHLENFINEEYLNEARSRFVKDALNKRWTIYKSLMSKYWWTSDNPGYCINLNTFEKSQIPDPFCNLNGVDAVLFYPLTKNYCLCIHPYDKGESLSQNLTNTSVSFETIELPLYKIINYCTLVSQRRLVISSESESLKQLIDPTHC